MSASAALADLPMTEDCCYLNVLLSPRAKANALVGFQGGDLKIKIAAPPAEGAANQALIKYLAGLLAHNANRFSLTAGQRGRRKILRIEGLAEAELWSRLKRWLPEKKANER